MTTPALLHSTAFPILCASHSLQSTEEHDLMHKQVQLKEEAGT